MYGTVRSLKSSIMYVIGTELSELSAHYLKKLLHLTLFTFYHLHNYIDQSAPNLGKIFVQQNLSSIKGPNGPEQLELFALELGKIAAFDFVYSLTSTNINQTAPNLVTMNMSIRSQMSLIMGQVIPDKLVFFVLEIEKLNFISLFGIYLHC